jgi:uncharacterized protein with FMN-binding domain
MNSSPSPTLAQSLGRAARKLFLSAFVIFTFGIYAIHERLAGSAQSVAQPTAPSVAAPHTVAAATPTTAPAIATQPPATSGAATASIGAPTAQPTQPPTDAPTQAPASPTDAPASPTAAGQYKDGQYTGPQVDAFYGWVRVQAVVQNGQITNVTFLQYPSDRRTSQRINSIAMPYLTSEAIQAQSANVDIISGATLTSEAFAQSLQAALDSAKP